MTRGLFLSFALAAVSGIGTHCERTCRRGRSHFQCFYRADEISALPRLLVLNNELRPSTNLDGLPRPPQIMAEEHICGKERQVLNKLREMIVKQRVSILQREERILVWCLAGDVTAACPDPHFKEMPTICLICAGKKLSAADSAFKSNRPPITAQDSSRPGRR